MESRFAVGLALAALLVSFAAPGADAHAFLDHSDPGVGSTVRAPPVEVRIWFTEALEPAFSTIAVSDAFGKSVTAGRSSVDSQDPKLLEVRLEPLPPGTYRVKWRVVSIDTHPTEGDFTFSVAP